MDKIKIRTLVLGSVQTNCYLVYRENKEEALIIDPAAGASVIEQAVDELHLKPQAILLTHGHFDHIGAAMEIKRHYGIKIYANELEKDVLNNSYHNLSELMTDRAFAIEADEYVGDGTVLSLGGFQICAISTPGHTKGGMCYLVSAEEESVLFSGDTLFAGSVGRYDFPTSSGTTLFASIRHKLMTLSDDLEVYPGHGMSTTIGRERAERI
ncbi:MAG: MBL fold metallo-hydrolase [Lachnospiraceae bacterium]|nr:MBL fold metallo-hydrolase [Lachnospiraceae bacterium]